MKTVTLSGGSFGGEQRIVAETDTEIRVDDGAGGTWFYEIRGDWAIFTGMAAPTV